MNLIRRIKSKYVLQNIFDSIPLNKGLKIIKYNKRLIKNLDYSIKDVKFLFFLKKIIKPIANCEDYLPIIRRIISSNNLEKENFKKLNNNRILYLFCTYLNKNNKFIPQINQIDNNEELLNYLNEFKIGFNQQFINNFYNEKQNFEFKKLYDFSKKYGKKIKAITFMDNNIHTLDNESYFIINYIIRHSNIEKIEDKYYNDYKSQFLNIFDSEYNYTIDKQEYTKDILKGKSIIDVVKEIKYYSLYLDGNNKILKPINDNILFKGENIQELEISKIDNENLIYFVNSLKNLNKLNSLSITCISDNELFNNISKVIKENSLYKLKMNLKYFEDGINIINKNLESLRELTIRINSSKKDSIIIKTISEITNLKKLQLISKFQIINANNIKYLSLKNVTYLKIPLYIHKHLFNLNSFFAKIPKLKTLILYGVHFTNNSDIDKFNSLDNIILNDNHLKNLKKIKFLNIKKNSSFFILKLIQLLSKTKIKEKIKEIKIENCDFDKNININELIKTISFYKNITNLQLNNISFEEGDKFNYEELYNFKHLEKLSFKGLDYEQNQISLYNLTMFLTNLSKSCKYLNEIGLSCKNINGEKINEIFDLSQNFKFLIKLNLFDNYNKLDYFSVRDDMTNNININLMKIKYYCMIDLRNLDLKGNYDYPKICIKDYINKDNYKKFSKFNNKIEKYYSYQNLLNNNYNLTKMLYSLLEKTFKIVNVNFSKDYKNNCYLEKV